MHDLSDYYLFSAHMVQHLLLAFAVVPLLLPGSRGWMIARSCAAPPFAASPAASRGPAAPSRRST